MLVHLHLDLESIVVRLVEPSDLTTFDVVIDAPADATPATQGHRLGDVVAARHLGTVGEDGAVWVDPAILQFLSAGAVDEGWDEALAVMIRQATTRGWVDESGWIRAHVVWPTSRH